MKKFTSIFLFAFLCTAVFAKQIDLAKAKTVGANFLINNTNIPVAKEGSDLTLVQTIGSVDVSTGVSVNYFYVFNLSSTPGFVIVSADDNAIPVLGYSDEGSFNPDNMAPACAKWLEGYKAEMRYLLANNIEATEEINTEWNELISGIPNAGSRDSRAVSPLVTTKWNQAPYYNALCPYDYYEGENAVTGCVATAMAQIMKYWNYPAKGTGFHSYSSTDYGTQSANFAGTTYNWGSMPNNVNSSNSSVATLMFHCGVSVDMHYGVNASGAWVIATDNYACSENAYKTYFGYNPATVRGIQRGNYTTTTWKNTLKAELDNSRPVQYAGYGSGGGHTWVCDGYDNNDNFHMNWGWGGNSDGYFSVNALNPAALGTGGGTGGFNSNHQAVIGIQPISGTTTTGKLELYAAITITPNPIEFFSPFTVKTDIANSGTSSFSGDYCAALFNSNGTFIKYIGNIISTGGSPLPVNSHYTNGLTFNDATTVSATVQGAYRVGIYYRPTGTSEWILAGNTSYTNPVNTSINPPDNQIKLSSAITTTPFIQGQQATVTVNIANASNTTYYGEYEAVLVNLRGDTAFQLIGEFYDESDGLPAGYTYSSPFLVFSGLVTANPGTYLLAIAERRTGSDYFYYCGGDLYDNPILINVVAPDIQKDIYEDNNLAGQAYTLPVSFSGNSAVKTTQGSNCHIGTDFDYYKINFPAGYTYTVSPRLNDEYGSTNGQTYTLDALVSYSTDGVNWSDVYDDDMPEINAAGNTSLYFFVAPFFAGNTGSYRLDMNLTRSVATGAEDEAGISPVSIFPNPATNMVTIQTGAQSSTATFFDLSGREVLSTRLSKATNVLDISNLPKGMYTIKLVQQNEQVSYQKLTVQ